MKKFLKFFHGLNDALMAIACVCLLGCAAFVNVSVLLRYCFHVSFQWTEEVARYLHIAIVMLLAGPLLWTGNHISMDLLLMQLKGAGRKLLRLLGEAATLVLLGYTFYKSLGYVASLRATGILTFSTKFEQWMPTLAVPVGFFFGVVFCAALMVREIVQFRQADDADESLNEEIADILQSNQVDVSGLAGPEAGGASADQADASGEEER